METFEIRDKEIDVEEIRKKIKEKIQKKRADGVYEKMINEYFSRKAESYRLGNMYIRLEGIEDMASIHIDDKIETHRKNIFGKIIVILKKIVRAVVAFPLRHLYDRQKRYNLFVAEYLQALSERVERIELEKELKEP